jgi:hypothetical protein
MYALLAGRRLKGAQPFVAMYGSYNVSFVVQIGQARVAAGFGAVL